MSNRLLLPGYRVPTPGPFGLATIADLTSDPSGRWRFDGIEWRELCGSGRSGALPCDASPTAGYVSNSLTSTDSTPGDREADAFFVYSLIECSLIGGEDYDAQARDSLALREHDLVVEHLAGDMLAWTGNPALDIATTDARRALGIALSTAGWEPYRRTVLMTPNIATGLGSTIIRVGDHLELRTGEKVLVSGALDTALSEVSDNAAGFIIVTGDIFGSFGEVESFNAVVSGVEREIIDVPDPDPDVPEPIIDGTPIFTNDTVQVALRLWTAGFTCGASVFRVQGYDDIT